MDDDDDALACLARGCVFGLLFAVGLWIAIAMIMAWLIW